MLENKVGHRTFDPVFGSLDSHWASASRDVANCFQTPDFDGLQEINLDNNMMTGGGWAGAPAAPERAPPGANRIGDACRFDVNPTSSGRPFPQLQVCSWARTASAPIERLGLRCLTSLRSLFLSGQRQSLAVDGLEGLVMLQELVLDRQPHQVTWTQLVRGGCPASRAAAGGERAALAGPTERDGAPERAVFWATTAWWIPADLDRLVGLTALLEINLANNTGPQGSKVPVKMTALNFDHATGMLDPRTEALMMGRADSGDLGGPYATRMELGRRHRARRHGAEPRAHGARPGSNNAPGAGPPASLHGCRARGGDAPPSATME
eukprot:jgi/Tetstr1/456755/TSEL_043452.t1